MSQPLFSVACPVPTSQHAVRSFHHSGPLALDRGTGLLPLALHPHITNLEPGLEEEGTWPEAEVQSGTTGQGGPGDHPV